MCVPKSAPTNPSVEGTISSSKKRLKKSKRKRDQDVRIPRNVSTFPLAGEKKINPRCQARVLTAYKCLHTFFIQNKNIRLHTSPPLTSRCVNTPRASHYMCIFLHSEKIGRRVVVAAHSHREGRRSSTGRRSTNDSRKHLKSKRILRGFIFRLFSLSRVLSLLRE